MAEPIGPGDLVECIDAEMRPGNTHRPPLVRGAIYCVTEIGLASPGTAGLALAEVKRPAPSGFYYADRFRPVSRRSDFARFLAEVSGPRDDVTTPTEREPATA